MKSIGQSVSDCSLRVPFSAFAGGGEISVEVVIKEFVDFHGLVSGLKKIRRFRFFGCLSLIKYTTGGGGLQEKNPNYFL